MDEITWTDTDEIGYRLFQAHPDVDPLSLRTNCVAAARISSAEAGGSKLNNVLIFLHINFHRPNRVEFGNAAVSLLY